MAKVFVQCCSTDFKWWKCLVQWSRSANLLLCIAGHLPDETTCRVILNFFLFAFSNFRFYLCCIFPPTHIPVFVHWHIWTGNILITLLASVRFKELLYFKLLTCLSLHLWDKTMRQLLFHKRNLQMVRTVFTAFSATAKRPRQGCCSSFDLVCAPLHVWLGCGQSVSLHCSSWCKRKLMILSRLD